MERLYSGATYRPVSYATEATEMGRPRGWVLHVTVMNGSPYDVFQRAVRPKRRFSHLWVSRTGRVEQYQTLDRASWAQGAGNTEWWSVETEGFDTDPLTSAQIESLARIHNFLKAADTVAVSPNGIGIGTHEMGGSAWGAHACPGRARANQRAAIIERARQLRNGEHNVSPEDIDAIASAVVTKMFNTTVPSDETPNPKFQTLLSRVYKAVTRK